MVAPSCRTNGAMRNGAMMGRDQRIALVTGASRGLGAAIAQSLGSRGWHVVAVARTVGGLEELDDRIRASGGSTTLAPMDVTVPEAMRQMAGAIAQRWGGLDLWAHCAIHAAPLTPASHIDAKDWDKSLAVNLEAFRQLIPLTELLLRARKGVALIPDDPRGGDRFHGSYGTTKAAQIALARSWQRENEKLGPRVVIWEPNPMATATRARFHPGEDRNRLASCATEAERVLTDILK